MLCFAIGLVLELGVHCYFALNIIIIIIIIT